MTIQESKHGLFVKIHLTAYKSGLMGALGPQRWMLLCALATYMDKKGYCYPTQEQLADKLNVSPRTIRKWVRQLKDFRWNGRPVVEVEARTVDGKPKEFTHNIYYVLPLSQLSIFDGEVEAIEPLIEGTNNPTEAIEKVQPEFNEVVSDPSEVEFQRVMEVLKRYRNETPTHV